MDKSNRKQLFANFSKTQIMNKPAAMESTVCGLLKTPQACCHPWTNWMSVQQHQFRRMTFPPVQINPTQSA